MDTDDPAPRDVFRKDLQDSARRFPQRIAESLQSQSRLVLELMDCVDELVLVLDPALRIIKANRYATVLLGYAASELITKPLSLLIEQDDRPRISAIFKESGPRRGGEAVFLDRAARRIGLAFTISPLADSGEEPHGYLMVGRQSGEPGRAADATNGLADRMLRGFADPLFVVDGPSRTICDCNEAALGALELSRDELLGRRLFDCLSGEEAQGRKEALMARAEEAYAVKGIFQERLLFPRKNGPALPCDCTGLPFFKSDGSLASIIVMLVDRSVEEEREAELASLIGRVNSLAAELASVASSYSTREEAPRLSDLGFTQRQVEIARLVAQGASSKDIGFKLGIAESTVKNHLAVMFRKLGKSSRIGFMREIAERRIKIS
jgi:PAS domain-containing protein/DNA-binding CsgD family transcriptional regulator